MEIFRNLHFEISFADALIHMPKFASMFKKMLNNKDKLIELTKTLLNENCSAVVLKKLPEKLGDPGRFLIPCDFLEFDSYLALADLGASINLMPLSIWKKLQLPGLTEIKMVLELADRIISNATGVAENVFVKVGKFYFPADFVVLDFIADPRMMIQFVTLIWWDAPSISYNNLESLKKVDLIDVNVKRFNKNSIGFSDSLLKSYPSIDITIRLFLLHLPTLTPFDESGFSTFWKSLLFIAIDDDSAVLGQRIEKHFRPIHYASKTMTEAETNYTTTEKEMLAVVYAFEKFRSYSNHDQECCFTRPFALNTLHKKRCKARCVDGKEALEILEACHSGPTGGHTGAYLPPRRFLMRFLWTTIYRMLVEFVKSCCSMSRQGKISQRDEMPQNAI
ncbi:reverse transcriptase domain-containing protein [Tanacetum coccineum]